MKRNLNKDPEGRTANYKDQQKLIVLIGVATFIFFNLLHVNIKPVHAVNAYF